ncbi:MAG: hypothetical protein AAF806_29935 [Bacteroidota bacterium]
MDIYSDNTLASFTNFLPEQISLDGKWEVALSEITYPCLYYNVSDGKFKFNMDITDTDAKTELKIPEGMYYSIQEVIAAMNEAIIDRYDDKNNRVPISITYSGKDYKLKLKLRDKLNLLNLTGADLAHILGFKQNGMLEGMEKLEWESDYPADIMRFHSIMVYTDIIEHGIVGDVKAPILRSFSHIPKLRGLEVSPTQFVKTEVFNNLQLRKMLKHAFHSIKIDLRTNSGQKVPFAGVGLTKLSLLFRKISN